MNVERKRLVTNETMKIVIVFWVIALCSKIDASVPASREPSPQIVQPATQVNNVAATNTLQNGTPVPVQKVNLQTVSANTPKAATLPVTVVQNPAQSIATRKGNELPVKANVPVINNQNDGHKQTLIKENVAQINKDLTAVPATLQVDNVQKNTPLQPKITKVVQSEVQKVTQETHKPVVEAVKVSTPNVGTAKQIVVTPTVLSNIVEKPKLNTIKVQKESEPKLIQPVIVEKSHTLPATVNKQHIQPVLIAQNKNVPVVSQTQVNTNLNNKKESSVIRSSRILKPTEKVIQPQIIPVLVPALSPVPQQLPTISPTFVKTSPNGQTVLRINKMDPASTAHAADYAARAAVKAANEALLSSSLASKAAHEANEAAVYAKETVKAIEITAAELAKRSKALELPRVNDSADVFTFSEKDADELADIVVAAINKALKSIQIPVSKLVTPKTTTIAESVFHESECLDNISNESKTNHKLVPKKSKPIPSNVHSSESKSSVKSSKLKVPKKLGFMAAPIYSHSAESVDDAEKTNEDERCDKKEEFVEDDIENCDDNNAVHKDDECDEDDDAEFV